ncbi:MAG: hypothetical protein RIG63_19335 [Coleofasciculus chthonoplastes F3-SA18-01]|uniref:hypothetical protein n=1 Tax=Coleofasciculus chthonoplastes TaxID=64178 RepID=UPI0032F77AD2
MVLKFWLVGDAHPTVYQVRSPASAKGEFEEAIHVAKTIENFSVKVSTLDTIVRELAAAGKSDRALAIAQTIQSYYGSREKMLRAIANYGNAQ